MAQMLAMAVPERGGRFRREERDLPEPGRHQVRIRVPACGVCHSDSVTVEGLMPGIGYPRVPGHEVIGVLDALGPDVDEWEVGAHVGPDGLDAVDSAPLLCAGITTFNALRNCGAKPGELAAIHGVGGLGHLGIQFAARQGFRTVAVNRGREKESLRTAVASMNEVFPLEEAQAAYDRMMRGKARFRVVLKVGS